MAALIITVMPIAVSSQAVAVHTHSSSLIMHSMPATQAPQLRITAVKDITGGFNVHILTSRFRWTPERVSGAFIAGEGHAHLYLDGIKIGRVYGSWFHVNTAQFANHAGAQLVSVELVADDHAVYAVGGIPIRSEVVIDVPQAEVLMRGNVGSSMTVAAAQDQLAHSVQPWAWAWLLGIPVALGIGLIHGTSIGRRGARTR